MIDAVTGKAASAQVQRSRFEGSYWMFWAEDVPAMGYKTFRIEPAAPAEAPVPAPTSDTNLAENQYYRVAVDPATGALVSLYDKEWGRELVDSAAPWGFAQFVRDTLTDHHWYDHESFLARSTLTSLRNVTVSALEDGSLWNGLRISADADGCITGDGAPGFACQIRLHKHEKLVELQFDIRKQYVDQPESVYVYFPFNLPGGTFLYEAQGGLVTPGENQAPGSSADWHTIQSFVCARGADGQVIFSSGEIPLVQFGEINIGKQQYIAKVETTRLFSWVMNNCLTHGFRGSKESEFMWRYFLTSTQDASTGLATRFGWNRRMPLAAQVFTASTRSGGAPSRSALNVIAPNALVVNATPAPDGGVCFHLREVEGQFARVSFDSPVRKLRRLDEVNVLGDVLETNIASVSLEPFEVKFVRLNF